MSRFINRELCSRLIVAKRCLFTASSSSLSVMAGALVPHRLCLGGVSSPFCFSIDSKFRAVTPLFTRSMSSSTSSLLIEELLLHKDRDQPIQLLGASDDAYGGVIVNMKEPMCPEVFGSMLKVSMSQWRQQGKRGVWIKLPIGLSNLVDVAIKEGFWFHHAEKSYAMLVNWISEAACTIPANASHHVGIGAFVVNSNRDVLVVQENSGRFHGTGVWKFPTGRVDEGEDICAAAVREVKEETGIEAEFVEVLAFRQSHNSLFGKSDLFFVCMLQPLSSDIKKQNSEIEAAKWMPIEEYAAQPFVREHELFDYVAKICLAKKDREYAGFSPVPTTTGFSSKKSYFYFNNHCFEWAPTLGYQQ